MRFHPSDNECGANVWEEPKEQFRRSRNLTTINPAAQVQGVLCGLFDHGLSFAHLKELKPILTAAVNSHVDDNQQGESGYCVSCAFYHPQ